MPKVSILVPVYNVEKYIERCAISLFEQTFDDIEYVFVNDCSQDNSIDILQKVIAKYPLRKDNIKLISHSENRGIAITRNTAIENALGKYVLYIDSDDYIENNTIKLMLDKAIDTDADIVVCNYKLEWENSSKLVEQVWSPDKIEFLKCILSGQAMPCVWNKLFKRDLFTENKIRAIEGLNFGEDFILTSKLIYMAKKICKVDNHFIHYVQSNTNAYTKKFNPSHISNILNAFNILENFFKDKQEYSELEPALLKGKLRKKIELIISSPKNCWGELFQLFPETDNIKDYNFLTLHEKIIYFYVKRNMKNSLVNYLKLYKNIFKILQNIKGR